MPRRLKITVLTKEDRVRIFTYANEDAPDLIAYVRDALRYLPHGGKIAIEAANDEDEATGQPS